MEYNLNLHSSYTYSLLVHSSETVLASWFARIYIKEPSFTCYIRSSDDAAVTPVSHCTGYISYALLQNRRETCLFPFHSSCCHLSYTLFLAVAFESGRHILHSGAIYVIATNQIGDWSLDVSLISYVRVHELTVSPKSWKVCCDFGSLDVIRLII